MEKIWAPWRMEYIVAPKSGACVFCQAALAGNEGQNFVLHRGREALVMLNLYPYNNGHLIIVPTRHVAQLEGLQPGEQAELMELMGRGVRILKVAFQPDGFNLGLNLGRAAGAGIEAHLHWHIVPRWIGDANFMPVVGETRVIPEYVRQTYDKLRPYFV